MGYFSSFKIDVFNKKGNQLGDKSLMQIVDRMEDVPECEVFNDKISAYGKWYDFDKDILKISQHYPGYVFVIDRAGEDYGDIDRTVVKDHIVKKWKLSVNPPTWQQMLQDKP
jgi:hypothetical protein